MRSKIIRSGGPIVVLLLSAAIALGISGVLPVYAEPPAPLFPASTTLQQSPLECSPKTQWGKEIVGEFTATVRSLGVPGSVTIDTSLQLLSAGPNVYTSESTVIWLPVSHPSTATLVFTTSHKGTHYVNATSLWQYRQLLGTATGFCEYYLGPDLPYRLVLPLTLRNS